MDGSLLRAPFGLFTPRATERCRVTRLDKSLLIDSLSQMKINQNTRLTGQKVILVPYEHSHVSKYHSWMEDPELRRLTASEPLSLEAEYEMQKRWREDEDKCTFIILSKQCVDEGRGEIESMVGDVNLFLTKDDAGGTTEVIAELEIMIAERAWRGRGLGREAVTIMILYAAGYLNIRKFQVKIGSGNAGSLRLFETLGFRRRSYSGVFDEVTLSCECASDDSSLGSDALLMKLKSQCAFSVDVYKDTESK